MQHLSDRTSERLFQNEKRRRSVSSQTFVRRSEDLTLKLRMRVPCQWFPFLLLCSSRRGGEETTCFKRKGTTRRRRRHPSGRGRGRLASLFERTSSCKGTGFVRTTFPSRERVPCCRKGRTRPGWIGLADPSPRSSTGPLCPCRRPDDGLCATRSSARILGPPYNDGKPLLTSRTRSSRSLSATLVSS